MKRSIKCFFGIVGIATVAAVIACGCGNYSNEDVEFQQALPAQSDLSAKLSTQSLVIEDSAEYYRLTRGAVTTFNSMMNYLLGIVDYVRTVAPSQRSPDVRIWGPFPNEMDRTWKVRMVMERNDDASVPEFFYHFDYAIEFSRVGENKWQRIITGVFAPSGGARRGTGKLILDTRPARAVGYPVRGLDDLDVLTVDYQTKTFPITVKMDFKNLPTARDSGAVYEYHEEENGSGNMLFTVRPTLNPLAQVWEVNSRWIGSGAGRADVTVKNDFGGARSTDCWGSDTRPTYSVRGWTDVNHKKVGTDDKSCVFPAP